MKGVLRQCRKYYQEKYMNFVRINSTEFIPSENNADDNIFPNNIIENPQQLIKEALEKFCLSEFKSQFKNPDLMFYTAALIFPYELKQNVAQYIQRGDDFLLSSRSLLTCNSRPSTENYSSIVTFIHEVLYKFSYQKLEKFNSIPELEYLFNKFKKDNKQLIKDTAELSS